jgi:hypothetical protein
MNWADEYWYEYWRARTKLLMARISEREGILGSAGQHADWNIFLDYLSDSEFIAAMFRLYGQQRSRLCQL